MEILPPVTRNVMDSLSATPKPRRPKINVMPFGNIWYVQYKGEKYKLDGTEASSTLWL